MTHGIHKQAPAYADFAWRVWFWGWPGPEAVGSAVRCGG